ncbi:MAG: fructose-6-phosphate aldolase [Clostridia bacterium]|nr:fructose-6-phosphate aldolase [Clostridia bacterium]
MQYMLDTASLTELDTALDIYPIAGVTTNPTILRAEGQVNLRERLLSIRQRCGENRSLHVQVTARNYEGILADAEAICALLGKSTYVKVPVTEPGLRAIRALKARNVHVTATAVYYRAQGLLAMEAGADYIAPYCNRMENNGIDFRRVIEALRALIDRDGYASRIVAASFKNGTQIDDALLSGAHAVTVAPSLLRAALCSPLVSEAVDTFTADYACYHGDTPLWDVLR